MGGDGKIQWARFMIWIVTGQLILGTDKRNPLFTVYAWEEGEDEEQLHVYYGLELLEVVPADRNAASFKMLVGRLYNAGLSRRVLQETFGVDLKTIQRSRGGAPQPGCRRTGAGAGWTPGRAQADAADRGLRASTLGGFEPLGNLRDW